MTVRPSKGFAVTGLCLLGVVVGAVGLKLASAAVLPHLVGGRGPGVAPPENRLAAGPQLWFVYLGDSKCGWCNHPDLPAAVRTLKERLGQFAAQRDFSYKAVGVAMDWNTNEGFGHLKKLGPFDEVSVGGNLSNTFLARHLGEGGAIIATPQILVYETTLTFAGDSVTPTAVMIAEPRRIFTAFGIKAISQWAASEDPLPPFSKALSTHLAKPEIE